MLLFVLLGFGSTCWLVCHCSMFSHMRMHTLPHSDTLASYPRFRVEAVSVWSAYHYPSFVVAADAVVIVTC